ncbi:MAG: hypothetical protein ACK40K_01190, partial [Raineya sp.]
KQGSLSLPKYARRTYSDQACGKSKASLIPDLNNYTRIMSAGSTIFTQNPVFLSCFQVVLSKKIGHFVRKILLANFLRMFVQIKN